MHSGQFTASKLHVAWWIIILLGACSQWPLSQKNSVSALSMVCQQKNYFAHSSSLALLPPFLEATLYKTLESPTRAPMSYNARKGSHNTWLATLCSPCTGPQERRPPACPHDTPATRGNAGELQHTLHNTLWQALHLQLAVHSYEGKGFPVFGFLQTSEELLKGCHRKKNRKV